MEKYEDVYGEFYISEVMESTPPKFSFIISAYNACETLELSLKSIFEQTHDDFNVFVANDGSNDNTDEIIKSYMSQYSNIVYIEQSNIGLTKTLNRLIDLANGEYIVRHDADDVSLPGRLDILLRNVSVDDDFITTSAYVTCDDGSSFVAPRPIYVKKGRPNVNALIFGNPFIHGTFVFKSSYIKSYKYDSGYRYAQDFELLLRSLTNGAKVKFVNEPTYEFTKSEGSISQKKKIEQTNFAKAALKKHGFSDRFILANASNSRQKMLLIIREVYLRIISWI